MSSRQDRSEKFNWLLTVKTNIIMLKITGLWPQGKTYKADFYSLYAVISVSLFLLLDVLSGLINMMFLLTDLQALTATICTMATKIVAVFKVYYFIKNIGTLKKLMDILMSDMFQPKNARQRDLVQPSLDEWKMVFWMLYITSSGAVFFFSSYPLVDGFFKEYRLPFAAWYPYNTNRSPIYELTYLYQVISITYIAIVNVDIDTLIAALNTFVGTQFDLLCDNLKTLQEKETEILLVRDKLIRCVRHHKEILSFAEKSNNFFNLIIFFQFFVSAVVLGLNLFQLTVVEPFSSEFYSFLSYENGTLVEIFMFCWFANEVTLKSEGVAYAAFESEWVNFSPDVKKEIIFFVTRCQRPLKISAMNIFYLSLETFMKILRAAYSYFAFLHQVNNN
ncbi:hypothetical protein Zmor_007835 [Zophobas morio]|uniref:Odorant receptor n=1 Tax=Zophobas morio TaxID=2755281 RepID=A0AA38IXK9_9CUCU|nr:hypothetical protein Zmor_007835 [Zophobas morio]